MATLLRVAVGRALSLSRRSTTHYFHKNLIRTSNRQPHLRICRPISTSLVVRDKIVPFILPDIGEGINEVQVLEWFVKEGDKVAEFDDICEVQSDKAAVKITSMYDGVIHKIHFSVDTVAKVGSPLMDVRVEGEGEGETTPTSDQTQPAAPATSDRQPSSPATPTSQSAQQLAAGKVLATPAVRRIAAENEIDLSAVPATGKGGRVLKEDILLYLDSLKAPKVSPLTAAAPVEQTATPTPSLDTPSAVIAGPDRVVLSADKVEPIKGFKRTMVKTMTQSCNIPQFGYCDEIEMLELIRLRVAVKDLYLSRGIQLTYLPFLIKAVSLSLQYYPVLNSHVDPDCTAITMKASHNIGFAMDTKDGLVVPNIKDVQAKSVAELALDMNRLTQLGSAGKLGPSDLTGGTFSLSNIGAIGGTYARPILLPPEVAIGAFGKISTLPRFNERGEVVRGEIMQVSWSADHRVIDGATMARFSNLFKSYVEHPGSMALELK